MHLLFLILRGFCILVAKKVEFSFIIFQCALFSIEFQEQLPIGDRLEVMDVTIGDVIIDYKGDVIRIRGVGISCDYLMKSFESLFLVSEFPRVSDFCKICIAFQFFLRNIVSLETLAGIGRNKGIDAYFAF